MSMKKYLAQIRCHEQRHPSQTSVFKNYFIFNCDAYVVRMKSSEACREVLCGGSEMNRTVLPLASACSAGPGTYPRLGCLPEDDDVHVCSRGAGGWLCSSCGGCGAGRGCSERLGAGAVCCWEAGALVAQHCCSEVFSLAPCNLK